MFIIEADIHRAWIRETEFSEHALESIQSGYIDLSAKFKAYFSEFGKFTNLFYLDLNILVLHYHVKLTSNTSLRVKNKMALMQHFNKIYATGEPCIFWGAMEIAGSLQVDYYYPKDTFMEPMINAYYRKTRIDEILKDL